MGKMYDRHIKGQRIIQCNNSVVKVNDQKWLVSSESHTGNYEVLQVQKSKCIRPHTKSGLCNLYCNLCNCCGHMFTCQCPDAREHGRNCKHKHAVVLMLYPHMIPSFDGMSFPLLNPASQVLFLNNNFNPNLPQFYSGIMPDPTKKIFSYPSAAGHPNSTLPRLAPRRSGAKSLANSNMSHLIHSLNFTLPCNPLEKLKRTIREIHSDIDPDQEIDEDSATKVNELLEQIFNILLFSQTLMQQATEDNRNQLHTMQFEANLKLDKEVNLSKPEHSCLSPPEPRILQISQDSQTLLSNSSVNVTSIDNSVNLHQEGTESCLNANVMKSKKSNPSAPFQTSNNSQITLLNSPVNVMHKDNSVNLYDGVSASNVSLISGGVSNLPTPSKAKNMQKPMNSASLQTSINSQTLLHNSAINVTNTDNSATVYEVEPNFGSTPKVTSQKLMFSAPLQISNDSQTTLLDSVINVTNTDNSVTVYKNQTTSCTNVNPNQFHNVVSNVATSDSSQDPTSLNLVSALQSGICDPSLNLSTPVTCLSGLFPPVSSLNSVPDTPLGKIRKIISHMLSYIELAQGIDEESAKNVDVLLNEVSDALSAARDTYRQSLIRKIIEDEKLKPDVTDIKFEANPALAQEKASDQDGTGLQDSNQVKASVEPTLSAPFHVLINSQSGLLNHAVNERNRNNHTMLCPKDSLLSSSLNLNSFNVGTSNTPSTGVVSKSVHNSSIPLEPVFSSSNSFSSVTHSTDLFSSISHTPLGKIKRSILDIYKNIDSTCEIEKECEKKVNILLEQLSDILTSVNDKHSQNQILKIVNDEKDSRLEGNFISNKEFNHNLDSEFPVSQSYMENNNMATCVVISIADDTDKLQEDITYITHTQLEKKLPSQVSKCDGIADLNHECCASQPSMKNEQSMEEDKTFVPNTLTISNEGNVEVVHPMKDVITYSCQRASEPRKFQMKVEESPSMINNKDKTSSTLGIKLRYSLNKLLTEQGKNIQNESHTSEHLVPAIPNNTVEASISKPDEFVKNDVKSVNAELTLGKPVHNNTDDQNNLLDSGKFNKKRKVEVNLPLAEPMQACAVSTSLLASKNTKIGCKEIHKLRKAIRMVTSSNIASYPEKKIILEFLSGLRVKPRKFGTMNRIAIKVAQEEIQVQSHSGNASSQSELKSYYFLINYGNGTWMVKSELK